MGLWLGASIATVAEILELIIDVILFGVCCCDRKKHQTKELKTRCGGWTRTTRVIKRGWNHLKRQSNAARLLTSLFSTLTARWLQCGLLN